jgi:hypothetical protein
MRKLKEACFLLPARTHVLCLALELQRQMNFFDQGCVMRSFGTSNTVKYALNTEYVYITIVF